MSRVFEAFVMVLAAVDYRQTVSTVVEQPDRYVESNPILGLAVPNEPLSITLGTGIPDLKTVNVIVRDAAPLHLVKAEEKDKGGKNERRVNQYD